MDNGWEKRLNNEEYKNWLKVSQALIQTKEALHDFSLDVIEKIHDEILKRTGASLCDGTCKTNKGKTPSCASCTNWVKEIKSYNKGLLNWKNTEPTKWHVVPWEIAKCFMNPQGSKTTASQNTGPDKTDLSGILNVVVNCKEFGNYLKEKRQPETVREIRNKVMHSPTMSFPEDEMKKYVNSMITFLEDELHLKHLEVCKEKVSMLKSLRDGEFEIRPEVEVDCLEGVLKGYELLLESGDEIDYETRESLNAISRFIANNKDLEKKFDEKLNKIIGQMKGMADHFETRMTSLDFNHGELKGKIEWLESRVNELEKDRGMTVGATSPRPAKQHDKSLYKNSLQCYAQKKNLGIPKYSQEETDGRKFISTVSVAGRGFTSEPKASKKEADQRAAEMALTEFTKEVSNENKETEPAQPSNERPAVLPKIQKETSVSCKNQLQEIAQLRKILLPCYETDKTTTGLFLSKVFFDGIWYLPDTPQVRKTDAEQKAAQFVLAYLETAKETSVGNCESPSSLLTHESSSKVTGKNNSKNPKQSKSEANELGVTTDAMLPNDDEAHETDDAECQLCTDSSIGSTTDATDSSDGKKSFKSKLNEYAQVHSPRTPVKYEDIDCSSGFRFKVTIMGRTFEGKTSESSKKEAKEVAAKEAWLSLNAQAVSPPKISSSGRNRDDFVVLCSPNDNSPSPVTKRSNADSNLDGLLDASAEISSFKNLSSDSNKDHDAVASADRCSSNVHIKVKESVTTDTMSSNDDEARETDHLLSGSSGNSTSSLFETDDASNNEFKSPTRSLTNGDDAESQRCTDSPIGSTTYPTDSSDDKKSFKSKLNEYAQVQSPGKPAKYEDIECSSGFRCKVTIMGRTFEGKTSESSKKEAKEVAAKEAWLSLNAQAVSPPKISSSGRNRDDFVVLCSPNDNSPSPVTKRSNADSNLDGLLDASAEISSFKNLSSDSNKDHHAVASADRCSSNVHIKVEESDDEARETDHLLSASSGNSTSSLLETDDASSNEIKSNTRRLTDDAESQLCTNSQISSTTDAVDSSNGKKAETMQPCESDGRKMYRSKLNEYCQSVDPTHKTLEYEDSSCDLGFLSKVVVMGKTYELTSPQKNKKEAREQAARQAWISLGLEQNFGNDFSTESPVTLTGAVGQTDVVQDETTVQDEREPNSKERIASDGPRIATADDKHKEDEIEQKRNQAAENTTNFKGLLLGHANEIKIIPKYVTKQVEETKEFFSKVFLDKRCFKGEKASRKKEAEQNAAKVALIELEVADSHKLTDRCEAFLKDYTKNIQVHGDFPKYEEGTVADADNFVVMVTVAKRWKASLDAEQAKKKDVEEKLAEKAIELLEKEGKIVQTAGIKNCRGRLNQFCQLQRNVPSPNYDVIPHEQERFSGILSFYTVENYESLSPQPSKDKAIASAARSACNDLDLI